MTRKMILAILICLLFNGCYSIDQQEGGITGVILDAETGEKLGNVKIARGYKHQAPVEQLEVKKLSSSDGEFDFPTRHKLVFNFPFMGCRFDAKYTEFHYYFSKEGYRGASVKVDPSNDQDITVHLARYESDQSSEIQSDDDDSGWTTFMKFNSTSLQFVTGLPAGATAVTLAIPIAVVVWPYFAIADMF
ncbi:MAG: hypothetical protein P1V97_38315 [Planctomycetota bacterium]|nr:hypothetical protein [Planctomycetota bacterium]